MAILEYFAKVLNSVNWIGVDIKINGSRLDLNTVEISEFRRELDMSKSLLTKELIFRTTEGYSFEIKSERFCSWTQKELGCIHYTIRSIDFQGDIEINSLLDFDVFNEDSNYDEQFWNHIDEGQIDEYAFVQAETKKTGFEVVAMMQSDMVSDTECDISLYSAAKKAGQIFKFSLRAGQSVELVKKAIIVSSFHVNKGAVKAISPG